jgi:hypothetical protein
MLETLQGKHVPCGAAAFGFNIAPSTEGGDGTLVIPAENLAKEPEIGPDGDTASLLTAGLEVIAPTSRLLTSYR